MSALSLNAPSPTAAARERTPPGALLPALLLTLATFAAGAVAFYAPPAVGEMAVVFPPGTSEAAAYAAVLAADGRFVGSTALPNIVVAYATDPEFSVRVQAQGGWFTVAARGLCTPLILELI